MKAFFAAAASLVIAGVQAQSVVGTWKPKIDTSGVKGANNKQLAEVAQERIRTASMKLNKDMTFGMAMAGKVMFGKYTVSNKIVTLIVTEIVGRTKPEVAKIPVKDRTQQMKIVSATKMYALPAVPAGKAKLFWEKDTPKQ